MQHGGAPRGRSAPRGRTAAGAARSGSVDRRARPVRERKKVTWKPNGAPAGASQRAGDVPPLGAGAGCAPWSRGKTQRARRGAPRRRRTARARRPGSGQRPSSDGSRRRRRVTSPPSPPARRRATRRGARASAAVTHAGRPAPRRTAPQARPTAAASSIVQWKLCGLTTCTSTTLTASPSARPSSAPAAVQAAPSPATTPRPARASGPGATSRPNSLRRASTCAEKLAATPTRPMRDGHRLQVVGDGEAAVEDGQRQRARSRRRWRTPAARAAGQRAQCRLHAQRVGAGRQPQRAGR